MTSRNFQSLINMISADYNLVSVLYTELQEHFSFEQNIITLRYNLQKHTFRLLFLNKPF